LQVSTLIILFILTSTPTTHIYTLSLHDALPISAARLSLAPDRARTGLPFATGGEAPPRRGAQPPSRLLSEAAGFPEPARLKLRVDRKSTRLNSSHSQISYAVFCLKKKKK